VGGYCAIRFGTHVPGPMSFHSGAVPTGGVPSAYGAHLHKQATVVLHADGLCGPVHLT